MIRALAAALLLAACATPPADRYAYAPASAADPELTPTERQERHQSFALTVPTTAICRDGWLSQSPERRGTCAGHGGVREWVNRRSR